MTKTTNRVSSARRRAHRLGYRITSHVGLFRPVDLSTNTFAGPDWMTIEELDDWLSAGLTGHELVTD
jgi:hypothetical protein